jgi:hypothetical protein
MDVGEGWARSNPSSGFALKRLLDNQPGRELDQFVLR